MEASGGLLSWRDDPEKSGARNGLPGKEVYPTGRSRTRQTGGGGGGGEGCRCSFLLVCSAVAGGGGGPLGWESNVGKNSRLVIVFVCLDADNQQRSTMHITAPSLVTSMSGSSAQVSNVMHHWKV